MPWLKLLLVGVMLLPAVLVAGLLLFIWRRRTVRGSKPFLVLCVATIGWAICSTQELLAVDLASKLFWADLQYLSHVTIPVAYLVLVLQYTGFGYLLSRRRLLLLSVVPALTVLFVWTNPFHHLMRVQASLDGHGLFSVLNTAFGSWFWVHFTYAYLLFIACIVTLIAAWFRTHPLYRRQILILLFGLLMPLACSCLHGAHFGLWARYDLSPFAVSISVIAVAWGLFYYRLFDLSPVARDRVIEHMREGMLVLDMQDRVIDLNPAAKVIFRCTARSAIGRPISELLEGWPAVANDIAHGSDSVEIQRYNPGGASIYEARLSAMTDRNGRPVGRVLLLQDITERKRAELVIHHMAYHDPLTGLPNRQFLQDALARELARARRRTTSFALMLLDLDGFKEINDSLGHEVGDQVLCTVARRLQCAVREGDIVVRLGGDEFLVLQTDLSDLEDAVTLAERVVAAIAPPMHVCHVDVSVSASLGLSRFPVDGASAETLLQVADQAMYRAKRCGRNRIEVAGVNIAS